MDHYSDSANGSPSVIVKHSAPKEAAEASLAAAASAQPQKTQPSEEQQRMR